MKKSLAREQEIAHEIQFDWQPQKQRQRYIEKENKMEKKIYIRYQIGVDFTAISSASVLDRLIFTSPLCLNF